jgi:hypothetical protein
MKAFFVALYQRLWLSYKSTLLGILVAALVEIVGYFAAGNANTPPWVHILAGCLSAPLLAWKEQAVKDGTIKLLVLAIFCLNLTSCAFFQRAAPAVEACAEKDPALVGQVMQALSDVEEANWIGALVALVPDVALRTCIVQAIVDATKSVAPVQGVPTGSAAALAENPQQRMTRRANAYLTLIK